MTKVTANIDGTINVDLDVGCFVVPNPARRFNEDSNVNLKNWLREVERMNGINDSEQLYIETWMVANDGAYVCSDNLADHGIMVSADGAEAPLFIRNGYIRWVPYEMLKGVKEGDTVKYQLYLPKSGYKSKLESISPHRSNGIDVAMKLNMTCVQRPFRYRNVGPFEEAVDGVVNFVK